MSKAESPGRLEDIENIQNNFASYTVGELKQLYQEEFEEQKTGDHEYSMIPGEIDPKLKAKNKAEKRVEEIFRLISENSSVNPDWENVSVGEYNFDLDSQADIQISFQNYGDSKKLIEIFSEECTETDYRIIEGQAPQTRDENLEEDFEEIKPDIEENFDQIFIESVNSQWEKFGKTGRRELLEYLGKAINDA